jgi:hypothetical protein
MLEPGFHTRITDQFINRPNNFPLLCILTNFHTHRTRDLVLEKLETRAIPNLPQAYGIPMDTFWFHIPSIIALQFHVHHLGF